MNFTGTELGHFRNFYTQNNNFEVDINCSVDNTTGHYSFGLTGASGSFQIDLISGKMYNNGLFVHSYVPNEIFELQMQITSGNYNIYKNGTPLVLGLSKPNYNYNQFFFNRQYNTDNANFDVFVSGYNQPNLYISQSAYYLNTGQTVVTGEIVNNGIYNYEIFTSNSNNAQSLYYSGISGTLAPGQTGYFLYTGNFANFNFNLPVLTNLYTNYNYPVVNFSIVNGTSGQAVILQPITSYSLNTLGQLPLTVQYTNYSGGIVTNNFQTDLSFLLTFITGTPQTYTGGLMTGLFSGDGSGWYQTTGFSGIIYDTFTGLLVGFDYAGSGQFSFSGIETGFNVGYNTGTPGALATGYLDISNIIITQSEFNYPANYSMIKELDIGSPVFYSSFDDFWGDASQFYKNPSSNYAQYINSEGLIAQISGAGFYFGPRINPYILSGSPFSTGWIDVSNIKTGDGVYLSYSSYPDRLLFARKSGAADISNGLFNTPDDFVNLLSYNFTGTNFSTLLAPTGSVLSGNIINMTSTFGGALGNQLCFWISGSGSITGSFFKNNEFGSGSVYLQGGNDSIVYVSSTDMGIAYNNYFAMTPDKSPYGAGQIQLNNISGSSYFSGTTTIYGTTNININIVGLTGGVDNISNPTIYNLQMTGLIEQQINRIVPPLPSINDWTFYTGSSFDSLEPLPYTDGQYYVSGGGEFAPNSYVVMRIDSKTGIIGDRVQLLISGDNILNPQTGLIFN